MDVRLAHCGPPESLAAGLAPNEIGRPALLVSLIYLKPFLENRHRYIYRDWVLDSGAFSAHNSGTTIHLDEYIETCKELIATDPKLTEVYALDVIGDWKASLKNTAKMWKAGIRAISCYHVGEPEHVLKQMAKDYPKIALGGVALAKTGKKLAWAEQCFARVWPKAIHGFGYGSERAVMTLPWHSTDATSWEIGPCKYGRWHTFGNMSVRGSRQNLRVEVEWYLLLEQRARQRWKKEMALRGKDNLSVRLAEANAGRVERRAEAFACTGTIIPKIEPGTNRREVLCTTYQMRNCFRQFADSAASELDVHCYFQHAYAADLCPKGGAVLDVCCGRGLLIPFLRYRAECSLYVGVDIHPQNARWKDGADPRRESRQKTDWGFERIFVHSNVAEMAEPVLTATDGRKGARQNK